MTAIAPSSGGCPFGFGKEPAVRKRSPSPRSKTNKANNRINAISRHIDLRKTINDIPGPMVEDAVAYNSGNHSYLTQCHEKYGEMFALTREGKKVIFVREPELVRQVLHNIDDFNKSWDSADGSSKTVDYVMNLIQPMLRKTIFNLHGEENASRRAAFRPTFLGAEKFVQHIEKVFDEDLKSWPASGSVDIQDLSHDLLRKAMLTVICGEFGPQTYGCLPAYHEVMDYFVQRYAAPDHDQGVTAEDDVMMNKLGMASAQVVQDFKRWFATCTQPKDVTKCSLMYLMVKHNISEEEMAATVVNVMIAAGEAPASALAQTLEELAMNGEVQTKLRGEVEQLPRGEKMASHLEDLPYSSLCMQEGLRAFAPATLVQRQAMRDCTLNGFSIPKGTIIGVCVHSLHNNAKVWQRPDHFNPDREDLDYETSAGYATFSKGPRGCPGKHVAIAVCQLALAKVVSNFRLSMQATQLPSKACAKLPKMVEWSVHGIPVVVQRISSNESRM